MDHEGELDLTSEPVPQPAAPARGPKPARGASKRTYKGSMQMWFKCCRVYSNVHIPAAVHEGKSKTWRFHCPRCGRLVEIPLED